MINFLSHIFIQDPYCYTQLVVNQVYTPISLLLYSHLPMAIMSILLGIFLLKQRVNLETKIFFILSLIFFIFALGDLTEWFVFLGRGVVMYARAILEILDPLLFIFASYFLYILIKKKDVPIFLKILWLLPLIPELVIITTGTNFLNYNWVICEVVENSKLTAYVYYIDIFYAATALLFGLWSIIISKNNRKQIVISTIGVGAFISLFFSMEYIFTGYIFGNAFDYNFFVYAFFGMPILTGVLGYLIVKYKEFNVKLIATQALVGGLAILIGSQFFFIKVFINFVLTTISFLGVVIFGKYLIKSVKTEIEQKEQLARLNENLKELIKQRESLVHLITHKVKGSFTRTKFIFAGLLDGTFGEINPDVKKVAQQGLDFDNGGIQTVDLVLNVANLENGLIKYDMKKIDMKEVVQKTAEEKKMGAEARGLKIETEIKDGNYETVGDAFWLKEVVNNLIENSIKYTKEGKIMVGLENKDNKILISVKDTGLGITEEDKHNLFTEGGRGKDSIKVNVDSTGYGLFTVKLVVEAHKGKVWGESEGAGKGSQFYVELPIA
jgi:signal transduction histidine kinase